MSEWRVQVVTVGPIEKHPNADTLSITRVWDYPVIIRTGEFAEGDKAVYVSVDSVVPADDPRWAFLDGRWRIRAKRLRGIYSQGLLAKANPAWEVGQDVAAELGVTKYEPPEDLVMGGENEHCPFLLPVYTDIEGLRRWPGILAIGEDVVITEKIHGASMRAAWHQDRLWVGSHKCVKRRNEQNIFWRAALQAGLEQKLQRAPGVVVYGEVYGQVSDLKYGAGRNDLFFAAFDALDLSASRYIDYDAFLTLTLNIPTVPVLWRGPWSPDFQAMAEGQTTLGGASHVREGIVIKPTRERLDDRIGRVILKRHGEGYLLRKGG